MVNYRFVGKSGLKVTEITYGNWLTHGSQVEDEQARLSVRAALEAGITSFDTADTYANTRAEVVLGEVLQSERRESLVLASKVFWPTGPMGPNDTGLSRKHILESLHGSLKRLQTDYLDIYYAHRFDHETPLEETFVAFADLVRQGKVHYIGISEWTAAQMREGAALAKELRIPLIASQPQYSILNRIIEGEVIPAAEELGLSQLVFSPVAQGILTGKYLPGQAVPAGSRATDDKGGSDMISRWLSDDERLASVQKLRPIADEVGLSMAQLAVAWVLQNKNVASAIIGASRPEQVSENVKAAGVVLEPAVLAAIDDAVGAYVDSDPASTAKTQPQGRVA